MTEADKAVERPDAAIEQLRNHQEQLDFDGVMVGVSRQAVDEVLAYLEALVRQAEQVSEDAVLPEKLFVQWDNHVEAPKLERE